jgi:hypothetical protein
MPFLVLAGVFLVATAPAMLTVKIDTTGLELDEVIYHHRTVLTFREQLPNLDLEDYPSATTPLYHVLLMFASFLVGTELVPLRFVSAIFSLICLLVVYLALFRRGKDRCIAFLFSLAFLFSPYFFKSSTLLVTDNAALLFALLSLMALDPSILRKRRFALASVFALFAILTRQVYAWLIGVISIESVQGEDGKLHPNLKRALPALLPAAGLAFFAYTWRGMVPTRFARAHTQTIVNADVLVYIVSLLGLYGSPLLLRLLNLCRSCSWKNRVHILSLVALGVALLVFRPVSLSYGMADAGGLLFKMTSYLPTVLSTSVVFWLLFPLGLVYLYIVCRSLFIRQDYLILVGFLLWMAANAVNYRVYQKYYESFLLFVLAYALVTVRVKGWRYWLGPAVLLFCCVGLGLLYLYLGA